MSFATDAVRTRYRDHDGTDGGSNSYVSYLNKVDVLTVGPTGALRRHGADWVARTERRSFAITGFKSIAARVWQDAP